MASSVLVVFLIEDIVIRGESILLHFNRGHCYTDCGALILDSRQFRKKWEEKKLCEIASVHFGNMDTSRTYIIYL